MKSVINLIKAVVVVTFTIAAFFAIPVIFGILIFLIAVAVIYQIFDEE
jgi:hypothetical protein